MKYSLRSLMIVAILGPALLAGVFLVLRELSLGLATLAIGLTLLFFFAAYDFVRGV